MFRSDRASVRNRRRSRQGSAAVEFALIGIPFFFMLFAVLELGMVFVTDAMVESATIDTGRLIRTRQAQDSSMTAAQFKTSFCGRMAIFSAGCDARTSIDVRILTAFRNANPPDPLANGTTFDASNLTYTNGQPGSLVLVRVWYKHTLFTPFLAQALSRLNDGTTLLTATTTFRNEPL
ncbi:pilus assembly protein [soil metagenome]